MLTVCACRTLRMRNLASNIANVLSLSLCLSRYDYNISCSGGLQISFRYCGNRRHFDQVTRWGGTEKGSASESFRLLEPRKGGEGERGSGVIASSASALRHICYAIKKSTTSWQTSDKYASFLTATPTLDLSPFSLPPSVSLCLSLSFIVCAIRLICAACCVFVFATHTKVATVFRVNKRDGESRVGGGRAG